MKTRLLVIVSLTLIVFLFIWWDNTYKVLPKDSVINLLVDKKIVKENWLHGFLNDVSKVYINYDGIVYNIVHKGNKWIWLTPKGKEKPMRKTSVELFLSNLFSAKILEEIKKEKPGYKLNTSNEVRIYLKQNPTPIVIKIGALSPTKTLRYVKIRDKILVLSNSVFYNIDKVWAWQEVKKNDRGKNKGSIGRGKRSPVALDTGSDGSR